MTNAQFDLSRSSGPPSRLWLLPTLLRAGLAACLTIMAGGAICALAWRATGTAPVFGRLCDGLGATLWLAALGLAPALDNWQRSLPPAPDGSRRALRQLAAVLMALGACLPLAAAPFAVLLAYDPGVVLASARPLDIAVLNVTLPPLLWRLLWYAGPACVALSLGLLLLARRLAGFRAGSVLWLGVGLLLHAPLFEGPRLLGSPVTLGNCAQLALGQLANPDLLQVEQIFGPLYRWVILLWLLAAASLALATCLRPVAQQRVPALSLGLAAGLAACGLRSWELGQRWSADAARLLPDSAPGLAACAVCVSVLVWAVLAAQDRPGARRELQGSGWLLLPVAGLLLLCSFPLIAADAARWQDFAVTFAVAALALWFCLAVSLAIAGLFAPRRPGSFDAGGGLLVLTSLACLLVACLPLAVPVQVAGQWGDLTNINQAPSMLAALVAALLQLELLPAAGVIVACLALAALAAQWIARPRGWRGLRGAAAAVPLADGTAS